MGRSFIVGAVLVLSLGVSAVGQAPKGKQPAKPAAPPAAAPEDPAKRTTRVSDSLGFVIQKGTEQGIEVAHEGKTWAVVSGEMRIANDRLKGAQIGLAQSLQINRFSTRENIVVVQVNVSPKVRDAAFIGAFEKAPKDRAPALVDAKGRRYEAVGFVYRDQSLTHIRYTNGAPLAGLSEAPSISRSTPDRELTLLFCVSAGVEVKEFRIGDSVVVEAYEPVVKCEGGRR